MNLFSALRKDKLQPVFAQACGQPEKRLIFSIASQRHLMVKEPKMPEKPAEPGDGGSLRNFKSNHIKAISRIAGVGTAGLAIFLFDKLVMGGKDLAVEGLVALASGNIELLGVMVGLPIAICIEGLVLYVGYCIGRSMDPDHKSTDPSC